MRASASAHHEAEIRELGKLAQEEAALRRVATMVAGDSTADEIFAKVAEEVALLLGVEAALVQRYDPHGDATVVGNWGKARETFPVGSRLTLDQAGVIALVHRTKRAARFPASETTTNSLAAGAREVGLRSAVGSPIFVTGRLWGAIVAGTFGAEPMPPGAESRITDFIELVATAISNIQARTEVEWLADEQAALRRVATMVARESPAAEIFAKVAEEVGLRLRAEGAMVHRFGPDEHATVIGSWGNGFRVGSRWKLDGNSVTALVYRTQRPARLDEPEHGSGSIAAGARELGMRSAVASPIIVNGHLWGAIAAAVGHTEPTHPRDACRTNRDRCTRGRRHRNPRAPAISSHFLRSRTTMAGSPRARLDCRNGTIFPSIASSSSYKKTSWRTVPIQAPRRKASPSTECSRRHNDGQARQADDVQLCVTRDQMPSAAR